MQYLLRICLFSLMVIAITSPVAAHPHHNHADLQKTRVSGFQPGFLHPFLGMDHLLAMVAVGILSVQAGGRALWFGPLSFLSGVVAGGVFGMSHLGYPSVETLVALSVVALGLTLGTGRTPPRTILFVVFAAFGFLHGYAHGLEIPSVSQATAYVCGFLLGSTLLHIVGISFGLILKIRHSFAWANPMRLSGAIIAAVGLFLMV